MTASQLKQRALDRIDEALAPPFAEPVKRLVREAVAAARKEIQNPPALEKRNNGEFSGRKTSYFKPCCRKVLFEEQPLGVRMVRGAMRRCPGCGAVHVWGGRSGWKQQLDQRAVSVREDLDVASQIDRGDFEVSDWEADFLDGILKQLHQGRPLTERQRESLTETAKKYLG